MQRQKNLPCSPISVSRAQPYNIFFAEYQLPLLLLKVIRYHRLESMKLSTSSLAILLAISSTTVDAFAPSIVQPLHTTTATTLHAEPPTSSNFLTPELAQSCIETASGTPLYAYSLETLAKSADDCLAFPNAYGLTVRYAMKSCPNGSILKYFARRGICIDASSGYEVRRAIDMGIPAENISLSSQELPQDFEELVNMGVKINACSVSQLERFGQAFAGKSQKVGVRVNPGVGSGGLSSSATGFSKTNVGGPASSFGIWHETVTDGTVPGIVDKYGLEVERIHTHIGSGSDPAIWQSVAKKSLSFCSIWDTVTALNLGGGYKVARNPDEKSTKLSEIGAPVVDEFKEFAKEHGRELKLEIEPGTYLVANAGALVTTIQDKVCYGIISVIVCFI